MFIAKKMHFCLQSHSALNSAWLVLQGRLLFSLAQSWSLSRLPSLKKHSCTCRLFGHWLEARFALVMKRSCAFYHLCIVLWIWGHWQEVSSVALTQICIAQLNAITYHENVCKTLLALWVQFTEQRSKTLMSLPRMHGSGRFTAAETEHMQNCIAQFIAIIHDENVLKNSSELWA